MRNLLLTISLLVVFSLTTKAQQKEKTYKVLAACGTCQFSMSSPTGCALAIQMGGKNYWVDGSTIADHGDEHAADGLCETVRKAVVNGTVVDHRFQSTNFVLIEEKKKK